MRKVRAAKVAHVRLNAVVAAREEHGEIGIPRLDEHISVAGNPIHRKRDGLAELIACQHKEFYQPVASSAEKIALILVDSRDKRIEGFTCLIYLGTPRQTVTSYKRPLVT